MTSKIFKLAGCLIVGIGSLLIIIVAVYFILPSKQNILILGIDAREEEGDLGRTDTMIVTTLDPKKPHIGILSIPRDLWVNIQGVGENRINTAHFFAESQVPGTGPYAAMDVVEYNFGIDVDYFARIRFDNLIDLIDQIEGVDIKLENEMSGYSAGTHHMNGEQVLAFVRDRSGSDDFFRMERGQLFLQGLILKLVEPRNWRLIPNFIEALNFSLDTNIPFMSYPGLTVALLRTAPEDIEYKMISRDMVIPFTTEGGAAVLAPNWDLIHPLIDDVFGQ
jgi:LCP family protein required for cell wall assembly